MKAIQFIPLPHETHVPPCLILIDRLLLRPVTAKIPAIHADGCEESTARLDTDKVRRVEVAE